MNNPNNSPLSATCFKRSTKEVTEHYLLAIATFSKQRGKASLRRRDEYKDVTYRYSYEKDDQPFSRLFKKNAVIKAFLLSNKPMTQEDIFRDLSLTEEYLPFFLEQIEKLKENSYITGEGTPTEPWSIIEIAQLRQLYDKRMYPHAARYNPRTSVTLEILRFRAELEQLKPQYSAKGRRLLKKAQEAREAQKAQEKQNDT